MSKVRLYGDVSGYVDLKAPDVANDVTITLPNESGPFATETYVDGVVADFATENYVDAAVATAGGLVAVKQAVQTSPVTITVAASGSTDISGLSITHSLSDENNKILLIGNIGQFAPAAVYQANLLGFAENGTLIGIAAAAGNRARATSGGRSHFNTIDFPVSEVAMFYLYEPQTTASRTYTIRGISDNASTTRTYHINRNVQDTNVISNPRAISTLTLLEVKV